MKKILSFMIITTICFVSCEEKRTDAPTGFRIEQEGNTLVLSWNSVSDADEYCIENTSTGWREYIYSTSIVDENPEKGTNYYELRACGTYGWSKTVERSYYFSPTVPDVPTGLTASASSSCIELEWNEVRRASYYNVYRATSPYESYVYQESTYDTDYKDCDVSAGTTYYYKVSAENSDGEESSMSSYASATISPLNTPSGLSATANSSCIMLEWEEVVNSGHYNVYRATSAYGSYVFIENTYDTYYEDCDVSAGKTYYYKVSAENRAGESSKSSYASAKVSSSGGGDENSERLPAPTGLTLTQTSSCVKLSWNSVSGAEGYGIWRKLPGGTYSILKATTSLNYSDYNVSAGTTYYYAVAAYDSKYKTGYASEDYITFTGNSGGGGSGGGGNTGNSPCPPSVSCSGNSYVTVKWSASTGSGCGTPASYTLYRQNRVTGQTETLKSNTTSTSYTDSKPFPGINTYYVIATNNYGTSSAGWTNSSEIAITAPDITKVAASWQGLDIYVEDLDVPDEWKPYYSLQMYRSTSYSGTYYIDQEWRYDQTVAHDYNKNLLVFEREYGTDMRGQTYYIKLRWVFEAPYSPSRVYGTYSSVKTVTHTN